MKFLTIQLIILAFISSCTSIDRSAREFHDTGFSFDDPILAPQVCTLLIDTGQFAPRDSVVIDLEEFEIPETTIRALEIINDSTIWFAGSNGKWGYTTDNGKNWHINQMVLSTGIPEFRSISVTENGYVFLVSITKPAAIFKSSNKGETWNMVYTDADTNAFFDAIEFWDNDQGMLLGDAINNRFHIAITRDGGETWTRLPDYALPAALDGENPFAASNTNISISGSNAWFGTGGTNKSRVYHSSDYGTTWNVSETPMASGQTMTGIYSVDFRNTKTGIVAGGDWNNLNETNGSFSYTKDGGNTWVQQDTPFGFISCVQFTGLANELFALKGRARGGESIMAFSNNLGKTWQTFPNSNYLSIQFLYRKKAWLSGKNKMALMHIYSTNNISQIIDKSN